MINLTDAVLPRLFHASERTVSAGRESLTENDLAAVRGLLRSPASCILVPEPLESMERV